MVDAFGIGACNISSRNIHDIDFIFMFGIKSICLYWNKQVTLKVLAFHPRSEQSSKTFWPFSGRSKLIQCLHVHFIMIFNQSKNQAENY
jgi:hypothetical protein